MRDDLDHKYPISILNSNSLPSFHARQKVADNQPPPSISHTYTPFFSQEKGVVTCLRNACPSARLFPSSSSSCYARQSPFVYKLLASLLCPLVVTIHFKMLKRSFGYKDRAGKATKPVKRSFRDDAKKKLMEQLNQPSSPPCAVYVS